MASPVFYLLAGPNGAGKSSLYRAAVADDLIPADADFVNADLHEAAHLQHVTDPQARSEQARQWADGRRAELLRSGQSFVSETVFSHESKLALIKEAQQNGFAVVLLAVCLDDPQRLLARVRQRVQEGGHDVPAERILARSAAGMRAAIARIGVRLCGWCSGASGTSPASASMTPASTRTGAP